MASEGEFPKVTGDILYASEINKFNNSSGYKMAFIGFAINSLLAHSPTTWSSLGGATSKRTTDSGATWGDPAGDGNDLRGLARTSRANGALAIGCDFTGTGTSITSDSGANWAAASTDPAGTRVLDMSFPTATVAVVGMDGGTTRDIYYSSDAGDNWTVCDSGPAVDVPCIDMVDGSVGLAVDVNGNIWATANAGVDWSDSGQNVGTNPGSLSTIIALTASTGIMINNVDNMVETFTTVAGGTARMNMPDAAESTTSITNAIKTTNGNVYFVKYAFSADGTASINAVLFSSEDSGVTWNMRSLGLPMFETSAISSTNGKSLLVEYDTDKLLLIIGAQNLLLIDEN